MKTIKISEKIHKNLSYLKTIWEKKTLDETIKELIESYFGDQTNDKKGK